MAQTTGSQGTWLKGGPIESKDRGWASYTKALKRLTGASHLGIPGSWQTAGEGKGGR